MDKRLHYQAYVSGLPISVKVSSATKDVKFNDNVAAIIGRDVNKCEC